MVDQADSLRNIIKNEQGKSNNQERLNNKDSNSRVIAITSGKGGVGKTNFTINIAISLANKGRKVVVFDADIGLANVDVILGLKPKYNLSHLIKGQKNIKDILYDGPNGIKLVAAGSGINNLLDLKDWELKRFILGIKELENYADIILIDTGAGLSNRVTKFLFASNEIIIIITPEPTSLTDAYALMKAIISKSSKKSIKIVVNKADSYDEGAFTAEKLIKVCKNFLKTDIKHIGSIIDDRIVNSAVKSQKPFITEYPNSNPSRDIVKITSQLLDENTEEVRKNGIKQFLKKFTILFN